MNSLMTLESISYIDQTVVVIAILASLLTVFFQVHQAGRFGGTYLTG